MKLKTRIFDIVRNLIRIIQFDRVLRVFTQGKKYDSFICKLVPNIYQYPRGTIRQIVSGEIHFEVDIHDYMSHFLYYGFKDISHSNLFILCNPGNTVIDIGANIGTTLLKMAKICGKNGYVLGFEPDPINFKRLQKNIALNNFTNLSVKQIGLGNKPGRYRLENYIEFNSGGKRISTSGKISSNDSMEVEINTLDNFLSQNYNSLNKIDLIKIDVEGFEFNVLKGAKNTIERYTPVLFIEVDDNNLKAQSASAKELIHLLSETGYSVEHAENKTPITENDDFSNCHYDIICRKR